MLPEQVDVFRIADETFMEEEGSSVPGLVHFNNEHPRLKLVDRDGFYVIHRISP
jgi:hypothetical protein